MTKIKVGDWVKLRKGKSRGKAQVEAFYPDIKGGVRLRTPLGGFVSWNIKDLVHLPKGSFGKP